MNIDVLHYCIDIYTYKNFTRVAELNHISQQALSQQIKNLENELGIKLFERNNRSVNTTPAGEIFIQEIRPAMKQFEIAIEKTRSSNDCKRGYLSIGSNGPSPRMHLSTIIREFSSKYPDIDISLRSNEYSEICESFMDGEFDAIIVSDFRNFDPAQYNIKECKSGVINAVFSINHPLAQKDFVTKEDLLDEQLICLDLPGDIALQKHRMERFKKVIGDIPKKIKLARDTETIDLLVESGLGFTLLNADLSGKYKQQTLKFVPIKGSTTTQPIWLIWRKHSTNPALKNFLEIAQTITK